MRSKLFFGIATMLLLASCEEAFETELGNEVSGSTEVFSATTETGPSTRTSLSGYTNGDGCYSLYWDSGDAISICDGINTAAERHQLDKLHIPILGRKFCGGIKAG